MGFSWIFPSINQAFWGSPIYGSPHGQLPQDTRNPCKRPLPNSTTAREAGEPWFGPKVMENIGPCVRAMLWANWWITRHDGVWVHIKMLHSSKFSHDWFSVTFEFSTNLTLNTINMPCFMAVLFLITWHLDFWGPPTLETRDGLTNLLPVKWMFVFWFATMYRPISLVSLDLFVLSLETSPAKFAGSWQISTEQFVVHDIPWKRRDGLLVRMRTTKIWRFMADSKMIQAYIWLMFRHEPSIIFFLGRGGNKKQRSTRHVFSRYIILETWWWVMNPSFLSDVFPEIPTGPWGRAQSPSGDAGLGLGSGQSSCSTDVPETPRTTTLNCEDLDWPLGIWCLICWLLMLRSVVTKWGDWVGGIYGKDHKSGSTEWEVEDSRFSTDFFHGLPWDPLEIVGMIALLFHFWSFLDLFGRCKKKRSIYRPDILDVLVSYSQERTPRFQLYLYRKTRLSPRWFASIDPEIELRPLPETARPEPNDHKPSGSAAQELQIHAWFKNCFCGTIL